MMVREPPPLRIRPRLEVGDRAAHVREALGLQGFLLCARASER